MRYKAFLLWAGVAGLLVFAYRQFGWQGVALVSGGLLMWLLLHFNRLMHVMRRASSRPIGHVGSAVMLNAKLQAGRPLLHVIAQTRSLGKRLSAEGEEPEVYLWTDDSGSSVTCEFEGGKLQRWQLERPAQPAQD